MFRRKDPEAQASLWLPTQELAKMAATSFYRRLDRALVASGFGDEVRSLVYRLTGEDYQEYVRALAEFAGVDPADRVIVPFAAVSLSTHIAVPSIWRQIMMNFMRALLVPIALLAAGAFEAEPLLAQNQGQIVGTVTHQETGAPISSVQVSVPEMNISTLTSAQGQFTLSNVPVGTYTVSAQRIGYETGQMEVTVTTGETTTVTLLLSETVLALEEIVVVGYGQARQRDVTGSITHIRAEQLNPVARSSVNQMLQGRVPGVNMATRGAQPGSAVNVNIRGEISSGGASGNAPLYVIDGVPMTSFNSTVPGLDNSDLGFGGGIDRDPLSYLNPSDIESITVLKDASAAAIYGSAAANGVVMITTHQGQGGSLQLGYRVSYSVQEPKEHFPMLTARQFMEEQTRLSYDWYLYDHGLAPYGTNATAPVPFDPMFSQSDIANAGAGTNWFDHVTRSGSIQEHTLTLRGGSAQTRLYGSFGYHDNKAILVNSGYARYTGRVNWDQTITDDLELSVRLSLSQQDGQNATSGSSQGGAEKFHMLEAAMSFAPTLPVRDENGVYSLHYNPLIMNPVSFFDIRDNSTTNNLFLAPSLEANLPGNFVARVTGQVDRESTTRGFYLPRTSRHALLAEGMAQKLERTRVNYATEGFVTYSNRFGNNTLSIMAGGGIYRADNSGFQVEAIGFFTDAFQDFNLGAAHGLDRTRLGSFRTDQTKLSQFTRLSYTHNDRYILNLVGRRDGSSIFAENHKYGVFPGISGAWVLSEESFLQGVGAISELKIRVGYGQAGNETVLAGNTLQLYAPGDQYVIGNTAYSGVGLTQVANPDLTWETITTLNAGLDYHFFGNRIFGAIDIYRRTATDRLANNPLPFNSPIGSVADNVGSTQSSGVDLSLNTVNISTPNFSWDTEFNVSHLTARWVERNPRVPLDPWIGERDRLGTIYGVRTAGIVRSPDDIPAHQPNANLGNLIYVDTNGDGVLNNDDIIILGNSIPKWSLGIGNTIRFGNLSLRAFAYGNLGYLRGNTFSPAGGTLRVHGTPNNTTRFVSEVWSHDNPDGWRPGVAPNPHSGDVAGTTDFNLYSASFFRLQDITLGYTIPSRLLSGLGGANDVRVFLGVQNLGVITRYPGLDPEYTEVNPYPQARTVNMGAEVRF